MKNILDHFYSDQNFPKFQAFYACMDFMVLYKSLHKPLKTHLCFIELHI